MYHKSNKIITGLFLAILVAGFSLSFELLNKTKDLQNDPNIFQEPDIFEGSYTHNPTTIYNWDFSSPFSLGKSVQSRAASSILVFSSFFYGKILNITGVLNGYSLTASSDSIGTSDVSSVRTYYDEETNNHDLTYTTTDNATDIKSLQNIDSMIVDSFQFALGTDLNLINFNTYINITNQAVDYNTILNATLIGENSVSLIYVYNDGSIIHLALFGNVILIRFSLNSTVSIPIESISLFSPRFRNIQSYIGFYSEVSPLLNYLTVLNEEMLNLI